MDSILYWPLWFIIIARMLVHEPSYADLNDFMRFNNACENFKKLMPTPKSRFKKWLVKLLLTEIDRHIEPLSLLVRAGLNEKLLVEDDRQ